MIVTIDDKSGFCFGVVRAINMTEVALNDSDNVYSVGDIVHNSLEVSRLGGIGLKTISIEEIKLYSSQNILIRAHGEPPSTYALIKDIRGSLIDATCPVVSKLQKRIKDAWRMMNEVNGQVVLLGKRGHAEVVGLVGQIDNDAIIIEKREDLELVDFSRPIYLLSQTTQSLDKFQLIERLINERSTSTVIIKDTICRAVANRVPHLKIFVTQHDVILFVSGVKSSNGKALFGQCKASNNNSYMIESCKDIDLSWLRGANSVGICGATSTPLWQMEQVAEHINTHSHLVVPRVR